MYKVLKVHVKRLSDTIGERNIYTYDNLLLSRDYIISQVPSSLQLYQHEYECQDKTVTNLEFTLKGQIDEVIIVGAHYDSLKDTVGANDNASAVSVLIELTKKFQHTNPYRTIKFVFFVNEEPPFFGNSMMGSYQYHQYCKSNNFDIKGVIVMDLLGCYEGEQKYPLIEMELNYPEQGNFITFIGKECSKPFVDKCYDIFKTVGDFPIITFTDNNDPHLQVCNWSDHYWFNEYGSMMVTDTALYRYKYYHSKFDTYDRLDYCKMVSVMNGIYDTICELVREVV